MIVLAADNDVRSDETPNTGVIEATNGLVKAHVVRAAEPCKKGDTGGRHVHDVQFHFVYMLKGWARFMYEDQETLVAAGDCVHQRPGIRHFLFDYSPDMEYLEIVSPADFGTIDVEAPCAVQEPTAWT